MYTITRRSAMAFIAMLVALMFLINSCEESIDNFDLSTDVPPPLVDTTSSPLDIQYVSLSATERDQLAVYLTGLRYDQLKLKNQDEDLAFREIVYQTLANRPLLIDHQEEDYQILSFLIPNDAERDLLNLVILKQENKPRQAQIMRYPLTDSFRDSLELGLAAIGDYRGTLHILPLESLVDQFRKADLSDCFKLPIQRSGFNRPSGGAGGGGGSTGGGGGGPRPSGGGPTVGGGGPSGGGGGGGGGGLGGCTETFISTRTNVVTGQTYTVVEIRPCDYGPIALNGPTSEDKYLTKGTKSAAIDCGKLLKIIGVVGRDNNSRVAARKPR